MSEINFAEVVTRIKKAHGWKGTDLAKALDVDPSSVSNWSRGRWAPNDEAAKKLLEMYSEIPPEAPEVLDPLVKKYCEEDTRTSFEIAEEYLEKIKDLEPTEIERLNPPDTTSINQEPIENGYAKFLENLRFFMKDTRLDTDEKLETYLAIPDGYISEFGKHQDRFEELTYIDAICDAIGVPWSVLAFSNAAKEDAYSRTRFQLQKMEEEMQALRVKAYTLGSELGYISESNDEIPNP